MRAIVLSLVVVACGKGSDKPVASDPPVGSAKNAGSAVPAAPPPVDPGVVVAVIADDRVKVLALSPTGIAVRRDVKLPAAPDVVRWLDRDHLVAVDLPGKAYLITGDTAAAYRMPPARAWKVKAGDGEESATYPMKLTLVRSAAGVELGSCATYYQGDDDPCVTWAVVSLDTSLEVGPVTTQPDAPTDDAAEPEIAPAAQPAIEWTDNADGIHAKVALKLGAAKREWSAEEPCPLTDATIKWLSAKPPLISFITTTDCGEGGPHDEEHLLRLPALADLGPDASTLVLGPTLWAHGADRGWTLLSGDRVVGSLDSAPVAQPAKDPAPPTGTTAKPAQTGASHLALRRGETLRALPIELAWKTPAGELRATVVDVIYKKAKHKPPISKLVVWSAGKRFDIVRTTRACDAFAELRPAKDQIVFRCASSPVGDDPDGTIEDWLIRWNRDKKAPSRSKHWSGDPAAVEPAWARGV